MFKKFSFKVLLQYCVPQHLLSRFFAVLTRCKKPQWLVRWFIKIYIRHFKVNMVESLIKNPHDFKCFNDFFTRALSPLARPIPHNPNILISPADGTVSHIGAIGNGKLIQAKGRDYVLSELVGEDQALASEFKDGLFATLYLSPKDYHRVHMPLSGELEKTIYIPGRLFSVNKKSVQHIPNLFARNERLICYFKNERGSFIMILVGAMLVAGIETVWAGTITNHQNKMCVQDHREKQINLLRGAEMGKFKFGSTVILLCQSDWIEWKESINPNDPILFGEVLGKEK